MKRILLNFLILISGILFFPAAFSFAEDVALPDLSATEPVAAPAEQPAATAEALPTPALEAAPQAVVDLSQIDSIVKDVFSAPEATPEATANTAKEAEQPKDAAAQPTAEQTPTTQEPATTESTVEPEVNLPETVSANVAASTKYPSVEITAKPEFTAEVEASPVKPIDDSGVTASSGSGEVSITISGDSEENSQTMLLPDADSERTPIPTFSQLPKSMRNSSSSSLVSRSDNLDEIQPQTDEEDILIKASREKTVDVAQIPIVPLDRETNPDDDLDILNQLTHLPPRKRDFVVKNAVSVERGDFKDPFYEELAENPEPASTTTPNLTSIEGGEQITPGNNVKKTELGDLKIKETKEVVSTEVAPVIPKSLTRAEFFVKDKNLNVEVKSGNNNLVKDKKNAYDALNLGMYESAISYYKKVIENNPNDKNALFGLATSYHKAKQYDKAKNAYLNLIKRDKNYFPAINNYIILVTERNADDAIPKLTELWKKNPYYPGIPAQIANLYYKKNNLQKAAEYYLQAINIDPDNLEYKYNVAVILEKMGEAKLAARYYKSLLDEAAKGQELPEDPLTIRDRYFFLMSDQS